MIKAINNAQAYPFSGKTNKPALQKGEGFKNSFVNDVKKTMPLTMMMAAMWTIFDIRKAPKNFITPLLTNASMMAVMSLGISAVSSWFKTKPEQNN